MKTSEIKVGTDYAYRPSKYGQPTRVTVVETGVERQEGRYRYSQRAVRNGVRVRAFGDREFTVTSREIEQEWAAHEQQERDRQAARKARQDEKTRTYAERARQARVLDDALAGHGVEPRSVMVYDDEARSALTAVGYEFSPDEHSTIHESTESRISALNDFVRRGTVNVRDLAPVLADLALKV